MSGSPYIFLNDVELIFFLLLNAFYDLCPTNPTYYDCIRRNYFCCLYFFLYLYLYLFDFVWIVKSARFSVPELFLNFFLEFFLEVDFFLRCLPLDPTRFLKGDPIKHYLLLMLLYFPALKAFKCDNF